MISLIFYIFVLDSPHAAFRSKFFTKLAFFLHLFDLQLLGRDLAFTILKHSVIDT